MLKSILFDLDGTLHHRLPNGGDVFSDYALQLGLPIHPEDRSRAARWEHYYFADSPEIRIDLTLFPEAEQFWENFTRRRLTALGCSPAQAAELAPQVSAHMRANHHPHVHVPEEALTVLPALKQRGLILGVVSNREQTCEADLEALGLGGIFHFLLAAGEINAYKPNRLIFEEALRRAGTTASETMYVGDNYFADIVGSQRAGLQPVLYDPRGLFPEAECAVITSFDQLFESISMSKFRFQNRQKSEKNL